MCLYATQIVKMSTFNVPINVGLKRFCFYTKMLSVNIFRVFFIYFELDSYLLTYLLHGAESFLKS